MLLSSGEMANPAAIEALLSQALYHIASGCLVLGQGRPCPAAVIELCDDAPLPPAADDGNGGKGRAAGASLLGSGSLESSSAFALLTHDVQHAIDGVNAILPSYARIPAQLVVLIHPALHEPLQRTAKGSAVRGVSERRFAEWWEERLGGRRKPSETSVVVGEGGEGSVSDSLGLAALAGEEDAATKGGEEAESALVQHLKARA